MSTAVPLPFDPVVDAFVVTECVCEPPADPVAVPKEKLSIEAGATLPSPPPTNFVFEVLDGAYTNLFPDPTPWVCAMLVLAAEPLKAGIECVWLGRFDVVSVTVAAPPVVPAE